MAKTNWKEQTMAKQETYDLIVIGGGPAGCIAAITAAKSGLKVLLIEKNGRLLNKLRISGKGRCNLTNACEHEDFFQNIIRGKRFFHSAFSQFDNQNLMQWVQEELQVPLKVERGQRVFPQSDQASSIADAIVLSVRQNKVEVIFKSPVKTVVQENEMFDVTLETGKRYLSKRCIIATGGKSYPATGSTGDGYRFAQDLGHHLTEILPALSPITTVESWPSKMAGLTLKNVKLTAYECEKKIFSEQGEMLFTHSGVSGPLVLTASSYMSGNNNMLEIDWKPALSEEALDTRLQRDLQSNINKSIKNSWKGLLPKSALPVFFEYAQLDPEKLSHQITREERKRAVRALKAMRLFVQEIGPLEAAIVTRGGVDCREISPRTMESKIVPNLYFAGEVCDLDAKTGGFNLQIAFSSGYVAGRSCIGEG